MSDAPTRNINLAEDFYRGLLEIQEYADAHSGQGRKVVNAIMNFAYQIVGSAPQAYPVLPVPQQSAHEFRRAVFRKRYILIYQLTDTELTFLLVYSAKQLPPLPLTVT